MKRRRLAVLDPGHFHAALIQKNMYPGLDQRVAVYAPLTSDLTDYLNRIAQFNSRPENPTSWALDIHAGPEYRNEFLREKAADFVVLSGRNLGKIRYIEQSIEAGFHVLADKPWIIRSTDLPRVARVLDEAESRGLVAYDVMTERFEITSILQRELVNTASVFGTQREGSVEEPGIEAMSVHYLMKLVAGRPLRRPVWFFDIEEYGEGLSDVGTHVVDLVQWTAFPNTTFDYRTDVEFVDAQRWPTRISEQGFADVTGQARTGEFDYFCNNRVRYRLRGVHVKLDILWNWEAPPGAGDVYQACFRGTSARVEIRQDQSRGHLPELYVVPAGHPDQLATAVSSWVAAIQTRYPGVDAERSGSEFHIAIPTSYRVGHEAHFAQVTNEFFGLLDNPKLLLDWEKQNMLTKYWIATKGVEIAETRPGPS